MNLHGKVERQQEFLTDVRFFYHKTVLSLLFDVCSG